MGGQNLLPGCGRGREGVPRGMELICTYSPWSVMFWLGRGFAAIGRLRPFGLPKSLSGERHRIR